MTFIHAPLLQPLRIGAMTIQNRFCAGPLTLPSLQGPFGEFSPDGLAYFEARAKGGFGLLFTGAFHPDTLVDPVHPLDSKQPLKAPKTFQRSAVELLERLDAYGTKMLPQVSMGYGRNALGCFCPSEIPYYHDPARRAPALTREQIQQKIDQMIATAVLLHQCGFPGIEVHAMHWGYLLDQFALSFMNHRTDEYGGALENRLRCAREIVEGVKAACGADFVVSMRLALKSYIKGYNKPSLHGEEEVGRTLEEGLEIARRLEAYGYDCLSVDFGQYDSFYYAAPPCYMEKGRVIPLAAAVKQAVKIPILCGGRMNDPDLAAQAIAQGKLDAVVLGRPSLADPAYPQKVATGRPEDICPCIGCNQGCIGALKVGRRAGCAVNPQAAREASFALTPAPRKKSVLVVGGGVAGMEAARCAALTGPDLPGQRVLVVGGGLVGCETALGYAQAGKQVTILEALPDILSAGIPVPEMNDSMLRDLLDEAGVVRRTGRRLSRVTEDGAVADGPDGEEKLSADHIVLAVGFAPRTSLAPELAGAGMEVYQVGDGSRVGSVMTAIGSAYTVGRML